MNTASLSGFLTLTEAKYCVIDLGSQLRELPSNALAELDNGQPYPHPYLGYAWLSLLIWNPTDTAQHRFWFLKLPLDKQAILAPGVHSDLVTRLYRSVSTQDESERYRLINDHPYQFTPSQEKLAALHALASLELAQHPSQYFNHCHQYFIEGKETDWRDLGLQGIADLVQRLNQDQQTELLNNLPKLTKEAFIALCQQLEHRPINEGFAAGLLQQANKMDEDVHRVALLRACSQCDRQSLIQPLILQSLNDMPNSLELLLVILSRYAPLMSDEDLALTVFDRLAQLADSEGFNRMVQHIAQQPGMQGFVMRLLRHPKLTVALADALGRMITMQRSQHERH